MAEKHPLCPQQLMWLQLVERRAPPHPPSLPGLRNKHLFFTKKEKRRSDRGRGCAFHMTCPGTERVFVNPAVCQLAPARRHKPLSATSPLTRHRALGWAGLGWGVGGPALACTSCQLPRQLPPAGWPKQSCADSDGSGLGEGHRKWGLLAPNGTLHFGAYNCYGPQLAGQENGDKSHDYPVGWLGRQMR